MHRIGRESALATHGFYVPGTTSDARDEDATAEFGMMASGLALAGANARNSGPLGAAYGILSAANIAQLDLIESELVVVSACRSGIGTVVSGEGVFGLRRAFFAAGARALVLSLWKVPDTETACLMGAFYQGLESRLGKAEALREAKLDAKRSTPHPFYWASFVCEGDWSPLPADVFAKGIR